MRPEDRGDDRPCVVAVDAVALIPEATHQLGERLGDPCGVPAQLVGRAGEAEAGDVWDHDVEGVGRVAAVGPGIGERADEVEVLDERVWPAVGEDQWRGVRLSRLNVHEVDGLAVDRRREVRMDVEVGFDRPPVELAAPAVDEVADVAAGNPVLPARLDDAAGRQALQLGRWELVGETGSFEPGAQVVEIGLGDVDVERVDAGVGGRVHRHGAHRTNQLGMFRS